MALYPSYHHHSTYNMTIAWTSASKGSTLFPHVRGNLSTNTTTEKSAISNILPSKLKLAQPGLCSVLLVWWCMLCYIKTNNTAAIYAAALLVDTASLSKVVLSSGLLLLSVCWACCQLAATGDWQQVH